MSEERSMFNGSTSNYVVCPQCPNCRKLFIDKSSNYPYVCQHNSSECASYIAYGTTSAAEKMPGKVCPTIASCKAFEEKAGDSDGGGSSSSSGLGGVIGGFVKREIDSQMAANKAAAKNLADSMGLGLVVDAAGGIGKVVNAAGGIGKIASSVKNAADKKTAERAEIERQKQEKLNAFQPLVDEKHQEVDSIIIDGDETALLGGIGGLFGIITSIKTMCEENDDDGGEASLSYSDKWELLEPVHQTALSKFDEASEKLQGHSSTGKVIGEFLDGVIISKRPVALQKEAGKKLMEKQKARGLRSVEEIQITGDAAACTESIIKFFDVIDIYKKHITSESVVDKKEHNLILGAVRIAAITKIDSALERLHGMSSEGNAIASLFEEVLAVEKNLKFSDTTGKFHDKNNMPLLASVGDTLSKLNPFVKKRQTGR